MPVRFGWLQQLDNRLRSARRYAVAMHDDLDADWSALYEVAAAFRKLAPWKWMLDADIFGVRNPRDGAIGWCAVLGGAGEFFGLAIYRGDRGFDFHRRLHLDPLSVGDEAIWGQDALVLSFVDRSDLQPDEADRIRRLGFSYRGRAAWPQIESHAPGRMPLPIDKDEIEFLMDVIIQACAVAARFREDHACLEPDELGRLLVRTLRDGRSGTEWSDEWVAEPAPPSLAVPAVDRLRLERIRAQLHPVSAEVECGLFPVESIVDGEDGPPYVPAIFMLADTKTGSVLHVQIGHPLQRAEMTQVEMLRAIETFAGIPRRVFVASEEVERVLDPLAQGLDIELVRVDELPAVDAARTALSEQLVPRRSQIR